MAQIATDVLEREIRIEARPATIFQFLCDPARMVRWFGKHATLDPRPRGVFRVDVDGRHVAKGEFVEIVPDSKVAFTWGWEGESHPTPPGSTTVEITLASDGDATILRLAHRDLPVESVEAHGRGWDHYLERLAVAAAGGEPGPDPWATPSE